jgi:O-antigen ligase
MTMRNSTLDMNMDVSGTAIGPPLAQEANSASVYRGVKDSIKDIWRGFRQEHIAFIVTCLYLVFEYNRPQAVYRALDIIPWGKTLLLLAAFLAFSDRELKRPPTAAVMPMAGFSACVLLSTAFAFSPSAAVEQWISFFSWCFVVLLITSVVTTRRRLYLFIAVYFLANLKMAQHGFRSWAMGGFGFSGWGVTGSPGWFQNSGEFSMEMVVFLPLVLVYITEFRHGWSRWVKTFFYALSIMTIGSIIASSSRGGVFGLIIVGLWFLSYSRHRIKALITLCIVSAIVYLVIPPEFKTRFEIAGEDKTSLARLAYWECGKQAIRENPLTGIGYKNWGIWVPVKHPEIMMKVGELDRVEVIHNTYLEAATELGLLGTTVYFALLLQIFATNRRSVRLSRARNDRFLSTTAAGLNGSLVAYLVPSYFMSVLYYPYVWVLLTLTVCVSRLVAKREQASRD